MNGEQARNKHNDRSDKQGKAQGDLFLVTDPDPALHKGKATHGSNGIVQHMGAALKHQYVPCHEGYMVEPPVYPLSPARNGQQVNAITAPHPQARCGLPNQGRIGHHDGFIDGNVFGANCILPELLAAHKFQTGIVNKGFQGFGIAFEDDDIIYDQFLLFIGGMDPLVLTDQPQDLNIGFGQTL